LPKPFTVKGQEEERTTGVAVALTNKEDGKRVQENGNADNGTKGIRERGKGASERKWEAITVRTDECTC
jgi:hypothetical protein